MIRKTPIVAAACSMHDALRALVRSPGIESGLKFRAGLGVLLKTGFVHLSDSGISSFYAILESLKTLSSRQEVVLPAYTAGSLAVAVKKAGLRPVLCDISLKDFNADLKSLREAMNEKTLAVLAVHMFGIPVSDMDSFRADMPEGAFLIEDCCQAMGSRIKDEPVGSSGDACFFSFNRGKNLPATNGGCIVIRNSSLEEPLRLALRGFHSSSQLECLRAFLKTALFIAGTDPYVYGMCHSLAHGFRETAPPTDFPIRSLGNFQSSLGLRCLRKADALFMARYRNGMALLKGLSGAAGLLLPEIQAHILPVFNRMPVLFENEKNTRKVQERLWTRGIESSCMYVRPLHHMFDLGYGRDMFPNACFLAERLLTLPVHPAIRNIDIDIMVDTIRGLL